MQAGAIDEAELSNFVSWTSRLVAACRLSAALQFVSLWDKKVIFAGFKHAQQALNLPVLQNDALLRKF